VAVDALRMRTVDDVVLVFVEPERDPVQAELERCYAALEAEGIAKVMLLSVGPMASDPATRRDTVELLERRGIRLVAVTDHRLNRGLLGMLSWLGVTSSAYPWSRLHDAARDVASRPELVAPIVRAARSLRAESPAAVGLDPDEG
jgi:hypothetical protein